MLTHNHGLLAYWFNGFLNQRLKTNVRPIYIMIGAVFSDTFLILNFFLPSEQLIVVSKYLHSIPIFSIFFFGFLLGQKFIYSKLMAFFIGWGIFHIAIDVVTHKNRGWPYFWPWFDSPIHGVADHGNHLLFTVEAALTAYILCQALLWMIKRTTKKYR
ncbi:MAG: hypothetical protein HYT64_02125 [Candidatus Yanofskybacteria bacterium]|nr:hypothetical protein [Candidatus Yanofskybacteria bacterium]